MSILVLRRFFLLFVSVILTCPALAAAPGKRIALVIGNSGYKHAPLLVNPTNDAEDVAKTLSGLGFQITKGLDLNKTDMDRALSSFASSLKGAEVGLFFYAGHGLQVSGQNYLVPIDAKLDSSSSLEFEAVRLDAIQRIMENETQTNVLILDACRDNPLTRNLARAMGTRSGAIGKGLAPQESGAGTIISYSTQPGNVALDGSGGRNSPFAGALVKHLPSEGRDLSSILVKVRNDVMAATAKRQVPWEHSALTDELVLARGTVVAAPPVVTHGVGSTAARQVEENHTPREPKMVETKSIEAAAVKPDSPTQPPPAFSDSFDGNALGNHWEVKNEDRDTYTVENGALLLFTNKVGDAVSAPNAISLTGVNLEGDWDMAVDFRPSFASGRDRLQIGIVNGNDVMIRAAFWHQGGSCSLLGISLYLGDPDKSGYQTIIQGAGSGTDCSNWPTSKDKFTQLMASLEKKGVTFILSKRGRSYHAKLTSSMFREPIVTHKLTRLNVNGRPSFALSNYEEAPGQTSALIDEFRIERVK